jgi:hypothetical protein
MIKNTVKIDNRFYKRLLEKKGPYNFRKRQGKKEKERKGPYRTRYYIQALTL